MKSDDREGSIHHDVPNHRVDVQILEKIVQKNLINLPCLHEPICLQ